MLISFNNNFQLLSLENKVVLKGEGLLEMEMTRIEEG